MTFHPPLDSCVFPANGVFEGADQNRTGDPAVTNANNVRGRE